MSEFAISYTNARPFKCNLKVEHYLVKILSDFAISFTYFYLFFTMFTAVNILRNDTLQYFPRSIKVFTSSTHFFLLCLLTNLQYLTCHLFLPRCRSFPLSSLLTAFLLYCCRFVEKKRRESKRSFTQTIE